MTYGLSKKSGLLLLNIAFVFIGIGTTILGPILPALSHRWSMSDAHAGSLFTAQFLGSALGGLLAGIHPVRSAITGFILAASGLVLLVFASVHSAVPITFAYGLGVGLVLTGINLTVSRVAGDKRSEALSWLNFSWSLGATICPLLAATFVVGHVLNRFLSLLSILYVGLAILIGIYSKSYLQIVTEEVSQRDTRPASLKFFIIYFAVLLFLYVGVETTLGGWLSTLASRLPHASVVGAFAISASSFFWLALLVGRGISPLLLKKIPETVLQPAAVGLSVAAICLLLTAQSFLGVAIAGSLAGLTLAPVFPLSLSFFLSHADRSRSVGLVFAICGTGGAVLPWITGIVSTYRHSLQWGLSVPLLAAFLMLLLSLNYVLSVRLRTHS
ncbi:MAG TPA: MFS transporter [Acidobacteriaceae bacterium]|jgi:fucose permease|nr:MFS transporter [Acidobacteriaceae bacterium]